jgi:tRNA pseudouridine(55) synthase
MFSGQVVEVLERFMGPISQVPPMHSALKKDGKALYEYAREGETVEREARNVVIHDLDLLDMQLQGDAPFLRLRVRCSKGTYIRTLGEDIAEALGCGGHLSLLRRVVTGPFAGTVRVAGCSWKPWTKTSAWRPCSRSMPAARLHRGHSWMQTTGRFLKWGAQTRPLG